VRIDVCANDDHEAVAALLSALAGIGAMPEDADFGDEQPLGVGLHKFRAAGGDLLTVYVDAWGVDLEGPDELVNRVREHLAG
jgi:hypothetical protein